MTDDTSNPAARPSQARFRPSLSPRDRVARLRGKARVRWFKTLGIDHDRPDDDDFVETPLASKLAAVTRIHEAIRCHARLVDLIAAPSHAGDGWRWADQFPADAVLAHLAHIDGELVDLLRSCEGVIASELNDAALAEAQVERA